MGGSAHYPKPQPGSKSTSILALAEPFQQWLEAGKHKALILWHNLSNYSCKEPYRWYSLVVLKPQNTVSKKLVLVLGARPTCMPHPHPAPMHLFRTPGTLWSYPVCSLPYRQRNTSVEVTWLPPKPKNQQVAKVDAVMGLTLREPLSPSAPLPSLHTQAWQAGGLCRGCGVRYDYISSVRLFYRRDWKFAHRSY